MGLLKNIGLIGIIIYLGRDEIFTAISNQLKISNVSIGRFNLSPLGFQINFDLSHRSPIPLKIDRFIGGVFIGNQKLGDVLINDSLILSPKEIIPVSIDVTNIGSNVSSIITDLLSGNIPSSLSLRGNALYNGVTVPINQPIFTIG